ncbi:hypothetical protein [Marinomonas fungiae]|uniref:hypothetical protein n=1 Tax=Marinomonas fungiae TaxID=1137284 RepID=UPI003A950CCD
MKYYLITHHFTNTNHITLELAVEHNSSSFESLGMIGVNSNGVVQDESAQYQAFDIEHLKTVIPNHTRDSITLSTSQVTEITNYATNIVGQNTSGNSVDLLNDVLDAASISTPLSTFFEDDKDSLSFAYASLIDFFTVNDPSTLSMWDTFKEDRLLDFRIDTAAVNWFVDNYGPIPSNLHYLEAYEYAYNTVVSQGYNGLSSEEFEQFDSQWGSLAAFVDNPDGPLPFKTDSSAQHMVSLIDKGELTQWVDYEATFDDTLPAASSAPEASLNGEGSTAEIVGVAEQSPSAYFAYDSIA